MPHAFADARHAGRAVSCVILVLPLVGACIGADPPSGLDRYGIVFASGRSGNGDLYVAYPGTGEVSPLVAGPVAAGVPRYDASQDRLLYTQFREADGRAVVMDGTTELFDDPSGESGPAWSPSGRAVAYSLLREGREDLFVASTDLSSARRLTDDEVPDRYPAWSPDGRSVAFARQAAGGWDLYVAEDLDADDGPSIRRLTERGAYVGHPAWSPDGERIAFDTEIDGDSDIAVLELATGEVTRLTERAGNELVPAWSPGGGTIAFAGEPAGSGNWDIWSVDVESGDITRLTRDPAFDGGPVYASAAAITALANAGGGDSALRR